MVFSLNSSLFLEGVKKVIYSDMLLNAFTAADWENNACASIGKKLVVNFASAPFLPEILVALQIYKVTPSMVEKAKKNSLLLFSLNFVTIISNTLNLHPLKQFNHAEWGLTSPKNVSKEIFLRVRMFL